MLASDVGGVRELLEPGTSGLLVPAGDAGELVKAMRRLLASEQLRARLGAEARSSAKRFSAQRMAREMQALYRAV